MRRYDYDSFDTVMFLNFLNFIGGNVDFLLKLIFVSYLCVLNNCNKNVILEFESDLEVFFIILI